MKASTIMVLSARALAVLGLSAILSAPAVAQQRAAAAEHTTAVRQITLVVEDAERAIDFYQRLGMTKMSDRTWDDGEQPSALGANDLPLTADSKIARLAVMKGTGEQGTTIALLAHDRPRLSSARTSLAGLGTGDTILTIEVADIQEAYRRLAQIGTRFQHTPYKFALTNGDGTKQTLQRMLAFDPDGHLAEIIQR
jgi:catechol 2,3-dioxygenase-like lactoylglutathione lyase family enzyme